MTNEPIRSGVDHAGAAFASLIFNEKSMKPLLRIFFLISAISLMAGCSVASRSLAEWKPMGGLGPWSAPNQRAVLETRDYHVSMMADAQGHDERWRIPDGRTADAWKVCERIVDLLAQTGELERWPETQAFVYKVGALRLGPYRLYLVSLFPDVTIFVPHEYGPLINRSNIDLVGSGEEALGDRRIMNHIYYGTSVPATARAYWISSDLGVPLTPVSITTEGGLSIVHSKVELIGHRNGEESSVVRVR